MGLIEELVQAGWLKTPKIIEAFQKIKRVDFLPAAPLGGEPRPLYGRDELKNLAELDEALPIGFGQTISQPLVVSFMLELLRPAEGEKILDIGSGSGWTSALLGEIVGDKGKVIAIEVIPELKEFGEKNVAKYDFIKTGRVQFICADGSKGYEKEAPFDRILASASAKNLPAAWKEQLKTGGRIVSPIGNSIWLFIKKSETESDEPKAHPHSAQKGFVFEEIEHPGFVFVPLITAR